ncbi:MAG: peptidase domain-containing ABC transporter [Rhodobacter sp.]|nr:peptidase domain-containing ABC transporter [Rhodobacter sp.]
MFDRLNEHLQPLFGRRLPNILQSEASECGLACLVIVAGHFGMLIDMSTARTRFPVSARGSTLVDLMQIADDMKLNSRAVRVDLEQVRLLKRPCILHWNHNHFVVLTAVGRRAVEIIDPRIGLRKVSFKELDRSFTGVALELWPDIAFQPEDLRERTKLRSLLVNTQGLWSAGSKILLSSLLLELAVVLMPIGLKVVVDEVLIVNDLSLLTVIVLALCLLLLVQVLAQFTRAWTISLTGASLSLQWKSALYRHLMRLPSDYFAKRHIGDVVSRFRSLDSIQQTITSRSVSALVDGATSIFIVATMAIYAGALTALAVTGVAINLGLRLSLFPVFRRLTQTSIMTHADENSHFIESVRAIDSIKALGMEERRSTSWTNYMVQYINADLSVEKYNAMIEAVQRYILGGTRIVLIYVGTLGVLNGTISIGVFFAILTYSELLTTRTMAVVDVIIEFRLLRLHAERISDITLAPPEDDDTGIRPSPAETGAGQVKLRNVFFAYSKNDPVVLQDLSLTVEPGESVAISGPSGAGKTTLARLITGLALPTSGSISIDGMQLTPQTIAAYRSKVGCVLQDDRLLGGSIAQNICGFDPQADRDRIVQVARVAAIHDEIMEMPMQYESLVGDMGSTLSGGQQQRIVLARALYRKPSVLILDEATSHLDTTNEHVINAAVSNLQMTRIIIAHRESTLDSADRVIDLFACQNRAQALQDAGS